MMSFEAFQTAKGERPGSLEMLWDFNKDGPAISAILKRFMLGVEPTRGPCKGLQIGVQSHWAENGLGYALSTG